MLSQELRPTTWDEVAGQKENIEILKAIVKNPDTAPKSLIFSGFFGTGKCVDQDTRVHTNLGYLKIKDIVPEKEQSFDSSGFMDISYKHIKVRGGYEASHLYYGGLKRTIKISSNLFSLEGTPNHRVLVMNDHGIYWKYLRDIRVMDRVCFCSDDTILFNNPTGDIPKFSHNESEFLKGYLVGLLICSGDFRVHGVVSISTSDSMGKYFLSMFDYCHTHVQSSLDDLEYSFEVYDKDLYSWGTEHQLGSCDSSIPEWVFSTSKDFLAGVLSSLFDILGVPSKGIFYTWKDSLMNGIRDILTLFGIVSKNVHNNGYHGLQIHGDYNMVKFNHIIHLNNVSKEQDMNNTCSELSYFDGSFQFLTVESVTESTSVVYDLTVPESHAFMGNGLVNHNTTCCRILARELNHIKDKNFDILNSPYLYEFDSTVIGNVDNIRNLREQFTVSYGDYWRVIVLDECIGSNGRVSSENGKTYRIADIVNKKLKIKVKSYNKETGVIEYKPITGWFKNSKKIIYEVRTSNHGKLLCSDNHVLITPKGDIQLKNLKVGDPIYRDLPNLSDDQMGAIIGAVLGDGSIGKIGKNSYRIRFVQGEDQKEWLDYKYRLFDNVVSGKITKNKFYREYDTSYPGSKSTYRFNTKCSPCFKFIYDNFRSVNRVRSINRCLLDNMNDFGLLVWFLDDGSIHYRDSSHSKISSLCIHTEGYDDSSQEIIRQWLWDTYSIKSVVSKDNRGYKCISIFGQGYIKKLLGILSKVYPDSLQCMKYKFPKGTVFGNGIDSILNTGKVLYADKIVSITQVYKTPVDTYDIEVKDNHNYFVGNILVHNCHTISQAAQNALLKMLEENVGRNMFVLATTEINKVLPTIRSRSLELTFTSVPYDDIIKNLNGVCQSKDIELSDKVKSLIADRSGGHMRNAHMLLDKYLLLGEDKFIESVKSAVTMYCEFLTAVHKGDKGAVLSSLNELLNIPKDNLESDWNTLMDESMKSFCGFPIVHQEVKNMLSVWGSDFNIVIQCYMSDWVNKMFMDMPYFQATMLNLYIVLSNALKRKSSTAPTSRPSTNSVSSRFGKAVR
jgi:DNA polymerase III gamma/tau subunit